MTRALTRQRCFSNMWRSLLRSDLTPNLIRRKLGYDAGTRIIAPSFRGELMNLCARRLRPRRFGLGTR